MSPPANTRDYHIVSLANGADATCPNILTPTRTPLFPYTTLFRSNRIVAGQTISGTTSQADLDAYEYTSGGNEWITIATARTGVGSGTFDPVFDLMIGSAHV